MEFDFYKLHACRNDIILVNCMYSKALDPARFPGIARRACRSHVGIGARGIVFLLKGVEHPIRMLHYAPNGSEAPFGNDALACAAKYAFDSGFASDDEVRMETSNGVRSVDAIDSSNFRVDLSLPCLFDGTSPIIEAGDTDPNVHVNVDGRRHVITPVHLQRRIAVIVTESPRTSLRSVGDTVRTMDDRGEIIPVFLRVLSREEIHIRPMFGDFSPDVASAAGAATVSAVLNGFCDRIVEAHVSRQTCFVQWDHFDNHVQVTLSPQYVFSGSYYIEEQ